MRGDGKTKSVQLWDQNNKLGAAVWVPKSDYSYSLAWGPTDMGQGSGAVEWLPVDMHGDGRTEVVQLWSYNNKLSMTVWAPNQPGQPDNSYSWAWGGDTQQGSAAVKWLPVDMHGDGKTQIVQLWDNNNSLGMNVWGPKSDYSYSLAWSSSDMGSYLYALLTQDSTA